MSSTPPRCVASARRWLRHDDIERLIQAVSSHTSGQLKALPLCEGSVYGLRQPSAHQTVHPATFRVIRSVFGATARSREQCHRRFHRTFCSARLKVLSKQRCSPALPAFGTRFILDGSEHRVPILFLDVIERPHWSSEDKVQSMQPNPCRGRRPSGHIRFEWRRNFAQIVRRNASMRGLVISGRLCYGLATGRPPGGGDA